MKPCLQLSPTVSERHSETRAPLSPTVSSPYRRGDKETAPRAATAFGPARELVAAINACCRHRGDTDTNRDALIAECGALSPRQQRDMADHFEAEARAWARATGVNTDFSTRWPASSK